SLADQVNRRPASELQVPKFTPTRRRLEPVGMTSTGRVKPAPADAPLERKDLTAWNGHGGFTHDGREYVITTTRAQRTPAPWVNVLANPYFGTVVSESGGAYSWC